MDKYLLITAAHNEQDFIEKTIISVINQDYKPAEWVIVSDGSTDETENIVKKYTLRYSFIKLIVNDRKEGRNFASKVYALNTGIKSIINKDYKYIGILDADVSFDSNYYSSLIKEFNKNSKLGIAGGDYFDIVNQKKIHIKASLFSVRGATQFFRRECFEQIGGIQPIKYGGEDALACYAARMNGWEINNIDYLTVLHHRPTGLTGKNILKTRFRDGLVEYSLGYHPLFQFVKCIKRLTEKPLFIGSVLRFLGFWTKMIKSEKRTVPEELLNYIKHEQFKRIVRIHY